jgi:hypothetical protein
MSELLTVEEVAKILNVSPDTVTRRFGKVSGVIDLGSPETPKKRRYRVLRIPVSVVEKYLQKRGGSGSVAPPEKKKPVETSPALTEDELVRELAALTRQSGLKAQQTLDDITERARLLQYVPADRWQDVVWFDED